MKKNKEKNKKNQLCSLFLIKFNIFKSVLHLQKPRPPPSFTFDSSQRQNQIWTFLQNPFSQTNIPNQNANNLEQLKNSQQKYQKRKKKTPFKPYAVRILQTLLFIWWKSDKPRSKDWNFFSVSIHRRPWWDKNCFVGNKNIITQ